MTLDTGLSPADRLDVRRISERCGLEGQRARAQGITSADNPYLRPNALPAVTGEGQHDWFRKCDAWWRGWDAQDKGTSSLRVAQPVSDRPPQGSGPGKSALMRSLGKHEPDLERLRQAYRPAQSPAETRPELPESLRRS